jgi:hypothetical protein
MTTKKEWEIIDTEMQEILGTLRIEAPNTGNMLNLMLMDIIGYLTVMAKQSRGTKSLKMPLITFY